MPTPPPSPLFRRRLWWLLWLALLLPIVQAAANWHALSHTRLEANGEADGKQALHLSHCDLCLTAAAVSGGALPSKTPFPPSSAARHAAPHAASGGVWLALPTRAYLSRAPPFAPY